MNNVNVLKNYYLIVDGELIESVYLRNIPFIYSRIIHNETTYMVSAVYKREIYLTRV